MVNKILGIIILIGLIGTFIFVFISNLDLLLLPKNSVTVIAVDQNSEVVDGLMLEFRSTGHFFTIEFDKDSLPNITELGVMPGDYTVIFNNIPDNYSCSKTMDNFVLNDGGKVKLEYECVKE